MAESVKDTVNSLVDRLKSATHKDKEGDSTVEHVEDAKATEDVKATENVEPTEASKPAETTAAPATNGVKEPEAVKNDAQTGLVFSTPWLAKSLGFDVTSAKPEKIGRGQIANVFRIDLEYGTRTRKGPSSVALKTTAEDPDAKALGNLGGLYEKESRFYKDIAPFLTTGPVAESYASHWDPSTLDFGILMKDYSTGKQSCDITGASLEEAKLCVTELGRLHGLSKSLPREKRSWLPGPKWGDQEHQAFFWANFQQRYGDKLKPEHVEIANKYIASFNAYMDAQMASSAPQGLVHGDYRLENMLLKQDREPPLIIVDWQTYYWGPILHDLSFFLSTALTIENRRAWQKELVQTYLDSLNVNVPDVTLDDCNKGVQMQAFTGMRQAITASNVVERTDRGDELFIEMFTRSAELVADTKALTVLPPPVRAKHLEPMPEDEELHPFTDKPLHNESFYFDVVDPVQKIGVWTRLGLYPNLKGSWYQTMLCGPDIPTVGLVDFEAPHPGKDLIVNTEAFTATHKAEDPLKSYRITAEGKGEAWDNPADALKAPGQRGRPVNVKMDLLYETDGRPYQWRMTTRYEIPCKITGTFSFDDKTFTFTKAVGQRDHSHGERNWWNIDWMWSAFHLNDGTHTHQVHVRVPGYPRFGVGYVQKEGEEVVECTDVLATEERDENGLVKSAVIKGAPLPLELEVTPGGWAPLNLVSPEGKVATFSRAWCTIKTPDGRIGAGWIEHNINEHLKDAFAKGLS